MSCSGAPGVYSAVVSGMKPFALRPPLIPFPLSSSPACGSGGANAAIRNVRRVRRGGANAAIRNVRRVRRGGGRSPGGRPSAEKPTPGPSRRAGGGIHGAAAPSFLLSRLRGRPGGGPVPLAVAAVGAPANARPRREAHPLLSRPGGALHRICHGMSCFVMRGVRMARPDRACCGRPGPAFRVFRPVSPACGFRHRSLLSIRLRFVFPLPGCPARGPTMPRAIARGRAGALAPARFARLIAPAREPERRAHLSCPPHRWFSAPVPVREGAVSGNRPGLLFCFHSSIVCRIASPSPIFFHNFLP